MKEPTTFFIATGHPIHVLLPPGVASLKGRTLHHGGMWSHQRAQPQDCNSTGSNAPQVHVEPLPVKASGDTSKKLTIQIQTHLKENTVGKLIAKIQIVLENLSKIFFSLE